MDKIGKIVRAERKDEHIKYFLSSKISYGNGFEDVVLENNSLPEINLGEVSTKHSFLGKTIGFPMMINAMTGGTEDSREINELLAALARQFNIPIAVGSQTVALENPDVFDTFKIVRNVYPGGLVLANVSANSRVRDAMKAIEMIDANAIQLHLNAVQEMCMYEGDRNFTGILDNIRSMVDEMKLPVIVKETGFGISYETAKKLYEVGVRYIDVGGKGGTNFVNIESARNKDRDFTFLENWGIPTALSLLECRNVSSDINIICTGGITKAEEIVKALCMGADMAGLSGVILRELVGNGYSAAEKLIERLMYETKVIMLLLGAKDINELKDVPYLLKGELREIYSYKFF
ncbi:MAG: type 2 isopentenyl-diphosphate Delta-isomerase [Caulobacteraceae bacterium]